MTPARKIARIKGVRNGIQLSIDPHQPLERLLPEVVELFRQMQHLASNARVSVEGIQGEPSPALIEKLERALKKEFAIHSMGLGAAGGVREAAPQRKAAGRLPALGRSINPHRTEGLILAGRVRSGQTIKARKHLVVLGDVNPGAEVEAGGDILILGTLGGKASAGMPNNPEAIILALDLRPTQLQIGGIVAAGDPGTRGNGLEYARVESGRIVVADYKQANPFKDIQRPEMR